MKVELEQCFNVKVTRETKRDESKPAKEPKKKKEREKEQSSLTQNTSPGERERERERERRGRSGGLEKNQRLAGKNGGLYEK